jgi:serine/threonine protein kinase
MTGPRDQATLVESSGAFDATVDSVHARAVRSGPWSIGSIETAGRTTVLPRVERGPDSMTFVKTSRPRFRFHRPLGEGGIGQVVAAVDEDIGREVAIKSLRREMNEPAHVARFIDEIRTVGALEHPNIVPIHDVGVADDGSLFFVMRCVQGETLESIIERLAAGDRAAHAHWTFERRIHLFRELLDAVAFAHEHGYVHRDIKPANVMVGRHGEVFLMDWGIAQAVGAPDDVSGTGVVGTPAYMSPEQARGEPPDARSDIYSLSVMLHEFLCLRHYLDGCLTVEAVLDGVQRAHAPTATFVPSPHQSPVPADLSWFVSKGLAKHASTRYQTVQEMIDRLDAREEGIIPIQCHMTFTKRVTRELLRSLDRHPVLFSVSVGVFLFAALALGIWRMVVAFA